jgi:hypothetical protein
MLTALQAGTRATLAPGHYIAATQPQQYIWLQIGAIDVAIKYEDEGVVVDLWTRGAVPECLSSAAATFDEAAEDSDEPEGR